MLAFDLGVARRQAFGVQFDPTPADAALARRLLDGQLTMRPHPEWALPTDLEWDEDPFGQRNWVAQLHMLRWLDPLRRVAMTGDDDARATWLRHVRSWVDANPVGAARSRYAWSDMMDGIRALALILGYPLAPDSDNAWLHRSIEQHGEWLADPANLGHSNHALHQHQGLLVVACALRRDDWKSLAVARHEELIELSYDEQGINDEGALAYHRANLVWWNLALQRLDIEGIPRPAAAARLQRSALGLAHATRPDGTLERIGDTDKERPAGIESPHLDYVLSGGAEGTPPDELTAVFDRGYVFGRSGWGAYERDFADESFYSLSFGRANRVHGHPDGGAVTFFANRQPWLVDSGKYGYISNDPMRFFVLSRAAHNVVTIRGRKYDPKTEVQLVARSATEELDDFTVTDSGYSGVLLTRRVLYSHGGDFLVVVDTVRADGEVVADQLWHLPPEVRARKGQRGFRLTSGRTFSTMMWAGNVPTFSVVRGSDKPMQGWVSPSWGKREAADTIIASRTGDKFRFITVIGSARKGDFSVDLVKSGPYGIIASVTSAGSQFHVHLDKASSSIHAGSQPPWFTSGEVEPGALHVVREATSGNTVTLPEPPPEDLAGLPAWGRSAAKLALGDVPTRLAIATTLLERLEVLGNGQDRDHGLRAAVVDVLGPDLMASLGVTSESVGVNRRPLIPWSPHVAMSHPRYELPIGPATEILTNPTAMSSPRIAVVETGGLVMPVAVRDGSTPTLVVRFHGAIMRARSELPIFQWLTTDLRSNNAFMIFQDPMLDLDRSMTLSWFLGTPEIDLYASIASIVEQTAKVLGKERIVLTGSSGGGYVAMQVASRLPNSHAVVFSPQTSVPAYHAPTSRKALLTCWNLDDSDSIPDDLAQRVSLLSRLERGEYETFKVTYVQNAGDGHHVRHHARPLRDLATRDQRAGAVFDFIDVAWGKGHVSPMASDYELFLNHALGQD